MVHLALTNAALFCGIYFQKGFFFSTYYKAISLSVLEAVESLYPILGQ